MMFAEQIFADMFFDIDKVVFPIAVDEVADTIGAQCADQILNRVIDFLVALDG